MKWKEADFKRGIETVRALLIYGPDAGQVDEYCDKAIEKLDILMIWLKSKKRYLRKVAHHQCSVVARWLLFLMRVMAMQKL